MKDCRRKKNVVRKTEEKIKKKFLNYNRQTTAFAIFELANKNF